MDASSLRPDFSSISSSFEALAGQFARVANLPAVDGGQRLLEAVERVMTRLDDMQREQRTALGRFQTALEVLTLENTARCVLLPTPSSH